MTTPEEEGEDQRELPHSTEKDRERGDFTQAKRHRARARGDSIQTRRSRAKGSP